MKIPLKYTYRNFATRKLTTGITVTGIALVVFIFAAVLMMAYGITKTLTATGSSDNIILVRKSSTGEITSLIDGETQNIVKNLPHVKIGADGAPVMSSEPVAIINLEKIGSGLSNVTVRGVSAPVFTLRPQVKLLEGRMFNFGTKELIVGESITRKFAGAQIGSSVRFAGDNWKIVGIFTADGSGFESEIWGDALQLLSSFNRGTTVSSVTFKLDNIANYDQFKRAFDLDRRLHQFETKIEQKYFEEQSEQLSAFIKYLGIFITIIFSIGSTIGAMITMYSAVANRTIEIGTLRSLGFSRRSILSAFLIESLIISLIGGVIGLVLASFLQFMKISTVNFQSFSELAFNFALSPDIIISSLLFAAIMGFAGGFLPSIRAARMNIVKALRAG